MSIEQYIAFLRGINVGGRNRVSMDELAGLFQRAGAAQVQTYIQSGNVLFQAEASATMGILEKVQAGMVKLVDNPIPVLLRSVEELEHMVEGNPFLPEAEVSQLHVLLLAEKPNPERVAELDLDRSPPDEYKVKGREIYLRLPNGVGRTKLNNAYFDRTLETTGTMRNWRTITKLLAMAREG